MASVKNQNLIGWLDAHLYPDLEDHWDDDLFRNPSKAMRRQ